MLVYSTCTITPQENEEQVAWALKSFPCLRLEKQVSSLSYQCLLDRLSCLSVLKTKKKILVVKIKGKHVMTSTLKWMTTSTSAIFLLMFFYLWKLFFFLFVVSSKTMLLWPPYTFFKAIHFFPFFAYLLFYSYITVSVSVNNVIIVLSISLLVWINSWNFDFFFWFPTRPLKCQAVYVNAHCLFDHVSLHRPLISEDQVLLTLVFQMMKGC